MPVKKITKTVIEKLVNLCEAYESGVMGNTFGWHDLERVCGIPYQTLRKYQDIDNAYKKAKKALKERNAEHINQVKKPVMQSSEMETELSRLREANKKLASQLHAYDQRFVKWLFNITTLGIDPSQLEKDIPQSLNFDLRKRNSQK